MDKNFVNMFDGVYNFRDCGGLPTLDGSRMKKGLLFRSDELSRLSPSDLEKMKQLKIKTVIDLRTPGELKSNPSRISSIAGIKIVNISIQDKSQEFTKFEFIKFLLGKSKNIDFEKIMTDLYYNMAFTSTKEIKEIITLLLKEDNFPILIHCTGGKDRTGFMAAIIQLLMGVPYETALAGYLYSNELIAPRMKKIEKMIRWVSLFQISPERMKPVLEVRREYLENIYLQIIEKYGTIEAYLGEACQLEPSSIAKLKELLLEQDI